MISDSVRGERRMPVTAAMPSSARPAVWRQIPVRSRLKKKGQLECHDSRVTLENMSPSEGASRRLEYEITNHDDVLPLVHLVERPLRTTLN